MGADVSFEIAVRGLSIFRFRSPESLNLDEEESEKEVKVRNNSKSSVDLLSIHTESGRVAIEPIPATLAQARS